MRIQTIVLCAVAWILPCSCLCGADYIGKDTYTSPADHYRPQLLIVGGSSSGTAAAITAGRLGIETVWTMRAPRDLGGLSTNAINPDSDLAIRYIGGLAMEYDTLARYTTGFHVGGRHNGEGYFAPFHVLFNYTRQVVERLTTVNELPYLYPLAVEKDPESKRITRVIFGDRRQPDRRVTIEPQITIDAEIEGDVAFLAGVEMTLRREGRQPSDDPTLNNESYAGRIFTPQKPVGTFMISGGALLKDSTFEADQQAATMAYNGSITLQDFKQGSPDSPWVLAKQPDGYDAKDFTWWNGNVQGVDLGGDHRRWNMDEFLSTVEGWRLPDGRHVLESMDIRDREANEKAHFKQVLCALWHLQHHFKQYRYGLSAKDFREGLPAKYMLSDFGTTTNDGNQPLPGLIYMREGRRMVNDHVFGGKLIEDDGSGLLVQKRYWHHRAAYYNCMLVDIHGVHKESVPGSGPEGMQLLRLVGHHNFGAPCIPFDVFVPRPEEVTGLLVSSAGAYTHEAYAAFPRMETGRIAQGHACAVAAFHALEDKVLPHEVDVRKIQLTNLQRNGQSIVYLEDTIPGTKQHVIDQMLAARRVPERNDQGVFQNETSLTLAEATTYLKRLFQVYTDTPVSDELMSQALAELGDAADQPVTRGRLLKTLNILAGLNEKPVANNWHFYDVTDDSPEATLLQPWISRRWIEPYPNCAFDPPAAVTFGEFKRHTFHALFGELDPDTVLPVHYLPVLAADTFNRPDGTVTRLASGEIVQGAGKWKVEGGQLRSAVAELNYLTIETPENDLELTVDLFLEQGQQPSSAGVLVESKDGKHRVRLTYEPQGDTVRVTQIVVTDGKTVNDEANSIQTMQRGFALTLNTPWGPPTQADIKASGGLRVSLFCSGSPASRFDNFEVRYIKPLPPGFNPLNGRFDSR